MPTSSSGVGMPKCDNEGAAKPCGAEPMPASSGEISILTLRHTRPRSETLTSKRRGFKTRFGVAMTSASVRDSVSEPHGCRNERSSASKNASMSPQMIPSTSLVERPAQSSQCCK